jgi:hypothetical protein
MFFFRSSAEPQSRPATAAEAGVSRVMSAIQAAAQKTGTGFDYLLRTAQRESSLQPTAQAPSSSARGLFQFIDSTWLTMMREEGRNLGLARYAEQIGRGENGRPTVADPAARREILALRDDPAVSALMAGAFTNRNAQELRSATGRNPTEGELYMAHFLGSGGASRLINLNETNPQATAARMFPDAAGANRRIFFDQGRPRTIAEVYGVLSAGRTTAVAGATATAPTRVAAAPQSLEAEPSASGWSAVPKINVDPGRPFHSMFSGGGGPINAFVAATWTAIGRGSQAGAPRVNLTTALTPPAGSAPQVASQAAPQAAAQQQAVGGPFYPVRVETVRRAGPLDLSQYLRPEARGR